jgi:hypothetical protein
MRSRLAMTSRAFSSLPALTRALVVAALAACSSDEPVIAPVESPSVGPSLALSANPAYYQPALPQVTLSTSLVTASTTGRTISVKAGQSFQAALDAAVPGDVIVLQAGATFSGNFRLKRKSGTGWITIRTSTSDSYLPPGKRVKPTDAPKLARLTTPNNMYVLRTETGAHHYRLIGLEITHPSSLTYQQGLLVLGDGSSLQNELSKVATDIVVDRSYIHGQSATHVRRCISLNSARTVVMNSYLSQCASNWADANAIGGWNGPGPYLIENNYLEGGSMMIMFGGADPAIPNLVPSDIEIRRNYFSRPTSWKGKWDVKNLIEFKNARRVLIEGNVFQNHWADAQTGFAFLWKSVNQYGGCTWCVVRDITFRYNKVRYVPGGFNIAANGSSKPAVNASRIAISHNVFEKMDTLVFTGSHRVVQLQGALSDITVNHNTFVTRPLQEVWFAGGATMTRFDFRNNIGELGSYGVKGDLSVEGTPTLTKWTPTYTFGRNVMVKTTGFTYPSENYFPSSKSSIGFVSAATGNYRLASGTAYKGKSTDGTDPGANIDEVERRTAGVVQ